MSGPQRIDGIGPCPGCGDEFVVTTMTNGQDIARCATCNKYRKCVPRSQSGREIRRMTDRGQLKPKLRADVLIRAGRRCELCGTPVEATDGLAVDHILSVKDGRRLGLTDAQLNSIENLAALCELCNSGKGRATLPLWLVVAIVQARTRAQSPEDAA